MPLFNAHRTLRNAERYDTSASNRTAQTNSSDANDLMNTHGGNVDSESDARILQHKKFDEQTRSYIDPVTRQPVDLTQLIQAMSSFHDQNLSLMAGTSAKGGAADKSSYLSTGGTRASRDM